MKLPWRNQPAEATDEVEALGLITIALRRGGPASIAIQAKVEGVGEVLGAYILRHVADDWDPPKAADHG